MAEIKTPLYELELGDGEIHFVIGPAHSAADILRHIAKELKSIDEIRANLDALEIEPLE